MPGLQRNVGIVTALREVGAFADDAGTPGVNAPLAATRAELHSSRHICTVGGVRILRGWPGLLDPLNLDAARSTGRTFDAIAAGLWARLSDSLAQHRGRVLVAWTALPQATRQVLAVVLIGAPRSWVV